MQPADGPSPAMKLSDADLEAMRETLRNVREREASVAHGPVGYINVLPNTFEALLAAAERERVYEEALAWYADPAHWTQFWLESGDGDYGNRARAALDRAGKASEDS